MKIKRVDIPQAFGLFASDSSADGIGSDMAPVSIIPTAQLDALVRVAEAARGRHDSRRLQVQVAERRPVLRLQGCSRYQGPRCRDQGLAMTDDERTRWLAGLKVGDLFAVNYARGPAPSWSVHRVERLTDTQVISARTDRRWRRRDGQVIGDRDPWGPPLSMEPVTDNVRPAVDGGWGALVEVDPTAAARVPREGDE